jgi:hypothetical protein
MLYLSKSDQHLINFLGQCINIVVYRESSLYVVQILIRKKKIVRDTLLVGLVNTQFVYKTS